MFATPSGADEKEIKLYKLTFAFVEWQSIQTERKCDSSRDQQERCAKTEYSPQAQATLYIRVRPTTPEPKTKYHHECALRRQKRAKKFAPFPRFTFDVIVTS